MRACFLSCDMYCHAALQGHEKEALNLMSSYLPKDSSGSPYAEGGGLYALGKKYEVGAGGREV